MNKVSLKKWETTPEIVINTTSVIHFQKFFHGGTLGKKAGSCEKQIGAKSHFW